MKTAVLLVIFQYLVLLKALLEGFLRKSKKRSKEKNDVWVEWLSIFSDFKRRCY